MLFNINHISSEPVHLQIQNQIIEKILDGTVKFGNEIQSVGTFARNQKVNRRTVKKAYDELLSKEIFHLEDSVFRVNHLSDKKIMKLKNEISKNDRLIIEQERIEIELRAAQQIQADLLPKHLPETEKYSLAAYSSITKTVGGDFYDYLPMNKDQFGLVIGDASGKGMPGALLISQIQAILKSSFKNAKSIRNTLQILNDYLIKNTAAKNFVTIFYGFLDSCSGVFQYCNAGHNYPWLIKKDGSLIELNKKSPALGIIPNAEYWENSVFIGENEYVVLYTDGITEAMNAEKELFGEQRLKKIIQKNRDENPNEIIDLINAELENFQGTQIENDDRTVMILKRKIK
ncbi:MAG: SpoIIE family protein phosphatase [Melioribacteraceae bacterium]|nr:SpoIIE family protein phosphatase [Melioribacteraceae bacterium]